MEGARERGGLPHVSHVPQQTSAKSQPPLLRETPLLSPFLSPLPEDSSCTERTPPSLSGQQGWGLELATCMADVVFMKASLVGEALATLCAGVGSGRQQLQRALV